MGRKIEIILFTLAALVAAILFICAVSGCASENLKRGVAHIVRDTTTIAARDTSPEASRAAGMAKVVQKWTGNPAEEPWVTDFAQDAANLAAEAESKNGLWKAVTGGLGSLLGSPEGSIAGLAGLALALWQYLKQRGITRIATVQTLAIENLPADKVKEVKNAVRAEAIDRGIQGKVDKFVQKVTNGA